MMTRIAKRQKASLAMALEEWSLESWSLEENLVDPG